MKAEEHSQLPEMSLDQLFASARAAGNASAVASLTVDFQIADCAVEHGTLTVSRNSAATYWLITVGITQGDRFHARIAQGSTASAALEKIERYCHWWLGI